MNVYRCDIYISENPEAMSRKRKPQSDAVTVFVSAHTAIDAEAYINSNIDKIVNTGKWGWDVTRIETCEMCLPNSVPGEVRFNISRISLPEVKK